MLKLGIKEDDLIPYNQLPHNIETSIKKLTGLVWLQNTILIAFTNEIGKELLIDDVF